MGSQQQYQLHRHDPNPQQHSSTTSSSSSSSSSMASAASKPNFSPAVSITTDVAKYGMAAAIQAGNKNNEFFTIVVADAGGHMLCAERMSSLVMAQSVDIAHGKATTAARFKKPTMALEEGCNGGRFALLSAAGCTLMGGGVPLIDIHSNRGGRVRGSILGAVGVSGLTPQNDQKYAQIAI